MDSFAGRRDHGCGFPAATHDLQEADLSSCASVGVGDPAAWLVHFRSEGSQPTGQCSLSARIDDQFKASLDAHEMLGEEWSARPNAALVAAWDAQQPGHLPVQALFYDISNGGLLTDAQRLQHQYYQATGRWLPVLKLDLAAADRNIFGHDIEDQLDYGYEIAARLNARYADTRPACPGNLAAYNCNGVLIRVTAASSSFHAWNPSPNSIDRNGVSFSYVRADVGTSNLAGGTQGLIIRELGAPTAHPLTLRCAFPSNAATSARPESCGTSGTQRPCDEQGVTTISPWVTHYKSAWANGQCNFKPSQELFQLSIDVRAPFPISADGARWNEIIIAAWPQNIPEQLPLEAFFYVQNAARATGLAGAQFIQQDYFQQTGRFLPVMRLNLTAADMQGFSYHPTEQSALLAARAVPPSLPAAVGGDD